MTLHLLVIMEPGTAGEATLLSRDGQASTPTQTVTGPVGSVTPRI